MSDPSPLVGPAAVGTSARSARRDIPLEKLDAHWAAAAIVLFAIVQQSVGHHNADNSWLFTVAEKILDGARPYVDVLETNPPASFLLYMPAAIIARATGLTTELVTSALVFSAAGICVAMAGTVLRRASLIGDREQGFLLTAAAFALLAIPSLAFAEREHIATIWLLPLLAIHAARMGGATPSSGAAIMAGVLAGFVVAIKPHFALAIVLSFAGVFHTRRAISTLFVAENICAGAIVALYAFIVYAFYPGFFDALPAIVDAYVSVRQSWAILFGEPWFLLYVVLVASAGLIGGRACLSPRVYPLLAASLGFTLAYFWQGKGWMNHELPAVMLAVLALAMLVSPMLFDAGAAETWKKARPVALWAATPATLCAPVLFGALFQLALGEEHPGLAAAVRAHAPPRPAIMALSPQLTAGFPLTRRVDGVWVGRAQRLWLTVSARMLLAANRGDDAYRARLRDYVSQDSNDFLADVRAHRPDVILVDKDERVAAAIAEIPALAESLDGYDKVATADDLEIWARRP